MMSQDKQFKQLERMAYLSYQQDGIVDLLIGWGTLAFGLNMAFDSSVWTLLAWMPILFYVPLKNKITVPRLGYVKFDLNRGGPGKKIVIFLILSFLLFMVLGIAVFLLSSRPAPPVIVWIREYTLLFYGLVGLIGFGLAGLISGIRRLFLYAVLSLLLMGGGQLLGVEEYIPFLLLGGSILVFGAVLLTRFVRRYPLAVEEG
jgi:hypothetical protein